jgi:putative flippase GtrA
LKLLTITSDTAISGMKNTFKQFVIFSIIGAIGTAGHYAVLIVLVEVFDLYPVLATTFGFITGALINYILNYHLTFKSTKAHRETLSKFMIVAVIGALINSLIMYLGTEIAGLYYLLSQILATGLVLVLNFVINKYWTFSIKEISTTNDT